MKKAMMLFLCIAVTGCLEEDPEEFVPNPETSDAFGEVTTKLQYEGSCEFLRNCSKWSSDGVSWGCSNVDDTCSGAQRFVAVPKNLKRQVCGDWVEICKGELCTTAEVKDVSCCGKWEASKQVFTDLNIDHGESTSGCWGYGEAEVTIFY